MVRLEEVFFKKVVLLKRNFNSYMVRLEVLTIRAKRGIGQISIPIWCDWKNCFRTRVSLVKSISIPIWCDWKEQHAEAVILFDRNFNSYMVRLEERNIRILSQYHNY